MDKVSVITVVFNGEKYLEQTIQSVINQSYKNIEYVVIDGGSTDGTIDILNKYRENISLIVSEPDRGLSDAMNKGANLATGDWVIYLHADDTFTDTNSVQKLINTANEDKNANWVTGYLRFLNSSNEVFRCDKFHKISWLDMLLRNVIRHQATMVRLRKSREITFNEEYKYAMDYDYFLRLWSEYGKPKVIKDYIADFRLDGNNLSSNYFASLKDEMRVRISFRKKKKQLMSVAFDSLIYILRYAKILLIHNRKK